MAETGLRERKKAATKAALGTATLRLAIAKGGIEFVTADEIAAEAGVSTRTFHNYFPNKEAAFLHDFHEMTTAFVDGVRERAAHQPVWDALRDAAIDLRINERMDLNEIKCREQLVHASPSLIKEQSGQFMDLFTEVLGLVADATGTRPDDMYPRLLLGAALVAMKTANEHWITDPGAQTLGEAIAASFAVFERGVTQPPPAA